MLIYPYNKTILDSVIVVENNKVGKGERECQGLEVLFLKG